MAGPAWLVRLTRSGRISPRSTGRVSSERRLLSGRSAGRRSLHARRTLTTSGRGLEACGYLADEGLSTAMFLAMTLQRPLFLEGEPGGGKTEVANALSRWTGGELVRLQCYEGIDVSQAVYEWDFSRQLLHLRAAELRGPDGVARERPGRGRRALLGAILGPSAAPPSHRRLAGKPGPAGTDHRRSRPGRRRVRGVPPRGAGRLLNHGARARDVSGQQSHRSWS